jgi:heat shock protein HslJ
MRGAFLAAGAALVGATATAQTPKDGYRAQGHEPAWSLTIAGGRMAFEEASKRPVDVAAPSPDDDEGVLYYKAQGLLVSILPGACTDKASGKRYADAVFITVAGKDYGGCGGAELPAGSLDGTSWHFSEIAGKATELTGDLLKDDRYSIDFGADAFSGYTGCNLIRGRYQVRGGVMTLDKVGLTTSGCAEPAQGLESRAWRILAAPMRVSYPSPDILMLTGEAGSLKLKRSAE